MDQKPKCKREKCNDISVPIKFSVHRRSCPNAKTWKALVHAFANEWEELRAHKWKQSWLRLRARCKFLVVFIVILFAQILLLLWRKNVELLAFFFNAQQIVWKVDVLQTGAKRENHISSKLLYFVDRHLFFAIACMNPSTKCFNSTLQALNSFRFTFIQNNKLPPQKKPPTKCGWKNVQNNNFCYGTFCES